MKLRSALYLPLFLQYIVPSTLTTGFNNGSITWRNLITDASFTTKFFASDKGSNCCRDFDKDNARHDGFPGEMAVENRMGRVEGDFGGEELPSLAIIGYGVECGH